MRALQEQFDEQGYVILKGVFSADVLDAVRNEMNHLVNGVADKQLAEGKISERFENEPFETRLFKIFEDHIDDAPTSFRPELHLSGMFDLFFHPYVLDIIEQFLGSEIRLYPNYTVRPKLPEWKGTEVLWHQDGGYTAGVSEQAGVRDLRMVNVWAPLVAAREENGCMQFAPGTHRLGVVPHEKRQYYLEISADHLHRYAQKPVSVELDPGDVVLFHNLLFHCGLPNHAQTIRWSCDWRYQDANQSTMREQKGHLARSRKYPDMVVKNAADWACRKFE
jgi:ectoine hydroxylase-related dioxygenase (phytanoyl-CoA dioxygenase family)